MEVIDQQDRRALCCKISRHVDEARLERVLRERFDAGRSRLSPEQRIECGDEHRGLWEPGCRARLSELLAKRRAEGACRRRGSSWRVASEQEMQVKTVAP